MLDAVVDYLPSPARHPARHRAGPQGHRGARAPGRREGAVRRAGLQDRGRPLRQAHLLPGLLGHGRQGRRGLQLDQGPQGAPRAHPADARQPPRGRRRRPWPATSSPASASRTPPPATRCATAPTPSCSSAWSSPSRSSTSPSSPRPRSTRTSWARRCTPCPRRTRRSGSAPTTRPARPSSPAWASCTSRCSSTACCASSASTPPSASRRWPTARRSPSRSSSVEYRHVKQTGGSGQFAVVEDQPRAHRPRRRLRVRRQDHRRPRPARVHPRRRPGHPVGPRRRRARRLPHGRRAGHARRRPVPRRRLLRDGVQDRRLDGVQEGRRDGQARAARADHVASRSSRPRTTWATSSATSPAAVAASRAWRPAATARSSGPQVPLGGDVRLRYRPPFAHPGPRDVHDAVPLLPAGSRSHRRARSSSGSGASSPAASPPPFLDKPLDEKQRSHEQGEVRAYEAACEYWDDGSY